MLTDQLSAHVALLPAKRQIEAQSLRPTGAHIMNPKVGIIVQSKTEQATCCLVSHGPHIGIVGIENRGSRQWKTGDDLCFLGLSVLKAVKGTVMITTNIENDPDTRLDQC